MATPKLRLLPRSEWVKLVPIFNGFNCHLPDNGSIVVAEVGSTIVGCECLHREHHIGPVYVAPEWRGTGLWPRMQAMLESQLTEGDYFYQYGTAENERRLASLGLLPLGWTLWGKRIVPTREQRLRGVATSA